MYNTQEDNTPLPKWETYEEYRLKQAQMAQYFWRWDDLKEAVEAYVNSIIWKYPDNK